MCVTFLTVCKRHIFYRIILYIIKFQKCPYYSLCVLPLPCSPFKLIHRICFLMWFGSTKGHLTYHISKYLELLKILGSIVSLNKKNSGKSRKLNSGTVAHWRFWDRCINKIGTVNAVSTVGYWLLEQQLRISVVSWRNCCHA